MKIKSIELINNPFFGNITFDFTDENGKIQDNIVLAGENGSGKTRLLNIIYEFTTLPTDGIASTEKRIFTVLLSEKELFVINSNLDANSRLKSPSGEFRIVQDYTATPNYWSRIVTFYNYTDENGTISWKNIESSTLFSKVVIKRLFRSVFSTVEINYNPKRTSNVTAIEIDQEIDSSLKSGSDLGTEIQQLFIDIHTNDAIDLQNWVEENEGMIPPTTVKNVRINRFKKAFSTVFDNMNYNRIITENNTKRVVFKKDGQDVDIASISSGEKQIVFRGAFLLRNQQSIKENVILIDEPEISLHPKWQTKIFDYYRNMFTDQNKNQDSQLFIATHSQYVLDSAFSNKKNTTIIIMKKSSNGFEINKVATPLALPSVTSAELNYFAFDIVSNDYHIELYSYLQQKIAQSLGKNECSIKECDDYIIQQYQYDENLHKKNSSHNRTTYISLPTYVRNAIDHPDSGLSFNEEEIRRSIELLIKLCK